MLTTTLATILIVLLIGFALDFGEDEWGDPFGYVLLVGAFIFAGVFIAMVCTGGLPSNLGVCSPKNAAVVH